jgi:putative transposase
MKTPPATPLYKRHRFPAEIISHCVWLYFRCSLSYRDVQEMGSCPILVIQGR